MVFHDTSRVAGLVVAFAGLGCNVNIAGAPAAARAGDRVYSAIAVGGGTSGQLRIFVYDPRFADDRIPGSPGAGASDYVAAGQLQLDSGESVLLQGTASAAGSFAAASGDGYEVEGRADGPEVRGTITTPYGDTAEFRGFDVAEEDAITLCGSYAGDASGVWSFVIGPDGSLRGLFSNGHLSGRLVGSRVRIDWVGTGIAEGASGTAEGVLSGDRLSVTGTWAGTFDGVSGGGTFATDGRSCAGAGAGGVLPPTRDPALPSEPACACRADPVPPGGACCCDTGGPCFCCDSISFR